VGKAWRVILVCYLIGLLLETGPLSVAGFESFSSSEDVITTEPAQNCRNPLFSTHWAGKSDIVHLNANPAVVHGLSLCPFYNGLVACCSAAFEDVQRLAFERWVAHWKRILHDIEDFQVEMEGLRVSNSYVKATKDEQTLFEKAFSRAAPVLDVIGTCFDTLLEYMAGVLCFSCDPRWAEKILLTDDGTQALSLKLHDSTHEELWRSCHQLAAVSEELDARIGDSTLAKAITSPYVDLSVFQSRISIGAYMVRNGLMPMLGPAEKVLEAQPEEAVLQPQRRLNATAQAVDRSGDSGGDDGGRPHTDLHIVGPRGGDRWYSEQHAPEEVLLFPVRDGRASGFECSIFPREAAPLVFDA